MYKVKQDCRLEQLAYILYPALGIITFDTSAPLGAAGVAEFSTVIRALSPLWRLCSKTSVQSEKT